MKQNKYDDAGFYTNYSQLPRSTRGLEAAGEWVEFRTLLPDLDGKRVLDLGCGYGWHCRYAREQGARSVMGIDLSENMLERAKAMTDDPLIEYRLLAMEDIDHNLGEFNVVLSSLALHYIERFDLICRKVYDCLVPGGHFVFSVEHPIYTSIAAQEWHYGPQGEKLHWPVDGYHNEGLRQTTFLEHEVTKYHRTIASQVNTLIELGFSIKKLSELPLTEEMLSKNPDWIDEYRRPIFFLLAAVKG